MKAIISSLWFKTTITVSLLIFVFVNVDLSKLLKELGNETNYALILLALLVLIISHIFGHTTWMSIIYSKEKKIKKYDILASYWKGLFFNLVLPTSIGGDIVKGVGIIKQYNKSHFFISTIFLDRIINLSFLIIMGCLAFFFYFQYWEILALFAFLVAAVVISIFFFGRWLLYKIVILFHKKKHRDNVLRLIIVFKYLLSSRESLLLVGCCAFVSQFLKTIVTYILAIGLGYQLSFTPTFLIVPVQTLVSLIPISINGIGLREFSNQIFEGMPGISVAELSVISLTGVVILILSTMPAIYFIFNTKN